MIKLDFMYLHSCNLATIGVGEFDHYRPLDSSHCREGNLGSILVGRNEWMNDWMNSKTLPSSPSAPPYSSGRRRWSIAGLWTLDTSSSISDGVNSKTSYCGILPYCLLGKYYTIMVFYISSQLSDLILLTVWTFAGTEKAVMVLRRVIVAKIEHHITRLNPWREWILWT